MNLKVVNKKVYVVSDIHNDADGFKLLLKKIDFEEDDMKIIFPGLINDNMFKLHSAGVAQAYYVYGEMEIEYHFYI